MKTLEKLLVMTMLMAASSGLAERDTIFLGDGSDLIKTVKATAVVNRYASVNADIQAGQDFINVGEETTSTENEASFEQTRLVMVLQTRKNFINENATSPIDLDGAEGSALGRWEFARIKSIEGSTPNRRLILTKPLEHAYAVEKTQVISVPEYVAVYVASSGRIEAAPWDGNKGGVVAFLVQNTLVVEGTISAKWAGFRGGEFAACSTTAFAANRGEGLNSASAAPSAYGNNANAGKSACSEAGGGGGGGGNHGSGGRGGGSPSGGMGGASVTNLDMQVDHYSTVFGRLIMGGGGGAGNGGTPGGAGGGAILIRAGSLVGNGTITADGQSVTGSSGGGGGGGGAGGTIIVRVVGDAECVKLYARGGSGGEPISGKLPGGGGGGGRILFQAKSLNCDMNGGRNPPQPSATVFFAGGGAGGSVGSPQVGGDGSGLSVEDGMTLEYAIIEEPQENSWVRDARPEVRAKAANPAVSSMIKMISVRFDSDKGQRSWFDLIRGAGGVYKGQPVDGLSDGSHSVQAISEYRGLWAETSLRTFKIDTDPPKVVFSKFPDRHSNSSSAWFSFGAVKSKDDSTEEEGVKFEYVLDNANPVACGQAVGLHGLMDGKTYTLRVWAYDSAGHKSADHTPIEWTVDLNPPLQPTVDALSKIITITESPFSGTAPEDASEVLVYVNGEGPIVGNVENDKTWGVGSQQLRMGVNWVYAQSRDKAKNVGIPSEEMVFTVDAVDPPAPTIVYPVKGGPPIRAAQRTVRGTTTRETEEKGEAIAVDVEIVGKKSLPTVRIPVALGTEGGNWLYELPDTLPDTLSGETYTIRAWAVDAAERKSALSDRTFTLKLQPPETKVTCPAPYSGPDSASGEVDVYFSLSSERGGVAYECMLQGSFETLAPGDCDQVLEKEASSRGTHRLKKGERPDGKYKLMVRAKDAAGNVDPSPESCAWTWDQTKPGRAVILREGVKPLPPPLVTNSTVAVFHFDAEDDSSPVTYVCSLDGGKSFAKCENPYVDTFPASTRPYQLVVKAKDLSGNVSDEVSEAYTWTVDTELPVAKVFPKDTNKVTNKESVTFEFTLENDPKRERSVIYSYTLESPLHKIKEFKNLLGGDGQPVFELEVSLSLPGDYHVTPRAYDVERAIYTPVELLQTYVLTVERKRPIIKLLAGPAKSINERSASFEFEAPGEKSVSFHCVVDRDCRAAFSDARRCSPADSSSRFTYQVEHGVEEGDNCMNVWAVDEAKNESENPEVYLWNVDLQAPAAPVIDSIQGELRVSTRFPAVEGRAEPNSEVVLFVGNASEAVARVGANGQGRWRAQVSQELSDGSHNIRASAKDQAGNEGPASESVVLLVDSQSPAQIIGGGVGCSAAGNGNALWALLVGMFLIPWKKQRRC
ncbi:hypothetical protein SAMN05444354_10598 [Stigmatella aurantiaca]|uniref:Bacterial Ig-like domain-containing protein n=1 Tax=Stigmatella aurantiaca TaxID=41 RepID=A0A1H7NWV7_STIAU|nr:Ig-like domain-containing protein [Stigmatella aurantiaca]SEL28001.1 hypothetical protein SAMN05444354_10598 [Stigmatella aurantiaca]